MEAKEKSKSGGQEIIVPTSCPHDCGGRCFLQVHVKDGVITRIETDDGAEPQIRACLRGHAYRQRVYGKDRLKFPMRRVGERGEGKFERISWDEALDTVAGELKRVKDKYGPAAIFFLYSEGARGYLHTSGTIRKLLNMFGGYTTRWGGQSAQGCSYACWATYGTMITDESRDGLVHSRLIIIWGWNPAVTIQIPKAAYHLAKAKEAGARIVSVDPQLTETAAAYGDQWIPIIPNTDAAMLIAMAYVMIKENLHDQKFLDRYTVGFERYRDYVMGNEDGTPKTPAWAEAITGVPAATIETLAREYATAKPAALITTYAPGRTAYGEQFHRAAITLAAMTGNVGKRGGGAAGFGRPPQPFQKVPTYGFEVGFPVGKNPLETGAPPPTDLNNTLHDRYKVNTPKIWDAILKGKSGGYPADLKLLYLLCGNSINQLLNTNKGVEAMKKLEFIVVHEQVMTPTAKFADILLPVNTHMERNDVFAPVSAGPYFIYSNKAIDPLYESKSDLDIATELAPRLGITDYNDKTEDEWLRQIVKWKDFADYIDDYDKFKKQGIWKWLPAESAIAFKEQIEDPEHHPFPTPSGKIEIYSQRLADLNNPKIPPIPKYIEAWESRNDPLAKEYPLQMVTCHPIMRAHSTFHGVPWLHEVEPHVVRLNPVDARARGIGDGDEVMVFNDRGELKIKAKVTQRIMPGVIRINEGAWYQPDATGVDQGGCPNVLMKDERSPGGAFITNTCLVQVQKV